MYKPFLLLCLLFCTKQMFAHPFPKSVVSLSIFDSSIKGEAKIPLVELESAVGVLPYTIININTAYFRDYFFKHIKAVSNRQNWKTCIESLAIVNNTDEAVGHFQQVLIDFKLTPPDVWCLRRFTFYYDAVLHQVVTDKALVLINEDWLNGVHNDNSAQVLGTIKTDIATGKLYPLEVNLQRGSWCKGFTSMINLGMQHIKEGTDHLLFLIALLLPAMLVVNSKKWGSFGGTKYSITRLLKIVTAFTLGHSVTLFIGASGLFTAPANLIEILIAVSILISAIHALYPLFPGREFYIAAGFGLIHGLAFASVLSNMNLDAGTLALSILGFNIGIELMQLLIIAMIIPWLILLSQTPVYKYFRIAGATLLAIAAIGWIIERSSGKENFVTGFITKAYPYTLWVVIAIALFSMLGYTLKMVHFKNRLSRFKSSRFNIQ